MINLHSNMVRLKVFSTHSNPPSLPLFTFQYGKIKSSFKPIFQDSHLKYLHSNMVRLKVNISSCWNIH